MTNSLMIVNVMMTKKILREDITGTMMMLMMMMMNVGKIHYYDT